MIDILMNKTRIKVLACYGTNNICKQNKNCQ